MCTRCMYTVYIVHQTSWADKQFISQAPNQGPTPNHDISNSSLHWAVKKQKATIGSRAWERNSALFSSQFSSVKFNPAKSRCTQPQIMIFQTQNKQPIPEERKCSNIQPHIYNLLFNIDAIHFKWHLYSQSSGAKF